METETKQRQDINQGNATAWQTANDTTRKQNKRETEISVRGASALDRRLGVASASEETGEYDATCQDKMLCITETEESLCKTVSGNQLFLGGRGNVGNERKCN